MDTTGVACSDIVTQGEGVASGAEFLVADAADGVADAATGVADAANGVADAGVRPANGVADAGVPTVLSFTSVFCDQDISVTE